MQHCSVSSPLECIPNPAFLHRTGTVEFMPNRVSHSQQSCILRSTNGSTRVSFDLVPIQYLRRANDIKDTTYHIAYRYFPPPERDENSVAGNTSSDTTTTTTAVVVFLNGLLSNMSGIKSQSLQQYANEKGIGYLCFDYRGHGSSSCNFVDCTMHDWMEDAQVTLDHVLEMMKSARQLASPTKVILVGSSMGAWIALTWP